MKHTLSLTLAASLALGAAAFAQAPPPPPPTPPAHHRILGNIFHRPARPGLMPPGRMPMTGQIIGNKKTHVYHLPGDTSPLPAPANRVYFRSEMQAVAAGYHRAGRGPAVRPRVRTPLHSPSGSYRAGAPGR